VATGIELITDALEELGYKSAESPIESDDIRVALRRLNLMLEEWEGTGRHLGFTRILKPADEVSIPSWAENPVMLNLAGRLAAPMRMPITSELAASISAANSNLLKKTALIGKVKFPDTLPIGSGNNCDYGNFRETFFPEGEVKNF